MLIGSVLTAFGGLIAFGIGYDALVRKSFKEEKNHGLPGAHANQHIDNARVDGAANQMSSQSTGF